MSSTVLLAFDTEKDRWNAIIHRRPEARNAFLYAVRTTGIYCRPNCASRIPRRENVIFFDSCVEAFEAGYRPCKRCRPDGPVTLDNRVNVVRQACRSIEDSENEQSLRRLALEARLSPSRFHNIFKEVSGLTPKQYADAIRAERIRDRLRQGESVTDAIFGAGFSSSSRFYEKSERILGMQPSVYRCGGVDTRIYFAITRTALGKMIVASTTIGVCSIALAADRHQLEDELRDRFPEATLQRGDDQFKAWVRDVAERIVMHPHFMDLPLDIQGTAFMRRVWSQLQRIPVGETRTYQQIAKAIGKPKAARAVANACAKNPLAIAIPCHRVVRGDGGLGGYRWGLDRKQQLLKREQHRDG